MKDYFIEASCHGSACTWKKSSEDDLREPVITFLQIPSLLLTESKYDSELIETVPGCSGELYEGQQTDLHPNKTDAVSGWLLCPE